MSEFVRASTNQESEVGGRRGGGGADSRQWVGDGGRFMALRRRLS